jgi:pimeloyl-ACP methyl ester carboxylesterase
MSGLIVYVGGLSEKPTAIVPLLDQLRKRADLAGYDTYVYQRSVTPFSRGKLAERGRELAAAISNYWDTQGNPDDVILMGHSIGGLLVRSAYLNGVGAFGDEPNAWAQRVSRIVLFAAPNRGLEAKRFPLLTRFLMSLILSFSHHWAAADALRGTPFLTSLRITWMRKFPMLAKPPLVVQVRGTRDTAVMLEDSIDLEAMPNSTRVEIAGADHQSIIRPDRPDEDRPGEQLALLEKAITGEFQDDPGLAPRTPQVDVTEVIFLLHGIRAGIFGWVERLGKIIRGQAPTVFVEEQSYGYLSAWKFMLPWGHDRQFRMFADWYTQMLSAYGSVPFHFVGHSNGTYVLGRSLDRVEAMTFGKVYVAGSVLPTDYPWTKFKARGQVNELVNACGNTDVPVGVLCKMLRGVGRRHLGTGGFDGFDDVAVVREQFVTIAGGHGAGLVDNRLPGVADYILNDTVPSGPLWAEVTVGGGFSLWSKFSAWIARLLAVALVGSLAWLIAAGNWMGLAIEVGIIALVLVILSAV